MTYANKLKGLFISTLKGFGIGALVSLVLAWLMFGADDKMVLAQWTALLDLIIGAGISVVLYSMDEVGSEIVERVINLIKDGVDKMLFGIAENGVFGIFVSMLGLGMVFLGLVLFVPVFVYAIAYYALDLVLLIVMTILEKTGVLEGKTRLCAVVDKFVPVSSFAFAAGVCYKLYEMYMSTMA